MSAKLKEISDHTGLDKAKNPLPSEAYPVVIADVNYGLNKKQSRGDQVAFSSVDFRGFSRMSKTQTRRIVMWLLCFCTTPKDRYVLLLFLCGYCLNILCEK